VKDTYLPYVKDQKKPSTYHDYQDIWNVHVKARAKDVWLRDITTSTVQNWLNDIGAKAQTKDKHPLAHTTLARIKSFLSGAFKYALQTGQLCSASSFAVNLKLSAMGSESFGPSAIFMYSSCPGACVSKNLDSRSLR